MRVRVEQERRAAAVARLAALRESGQLSPAHVRLTAEGLGDGSDQKPGKVTFIFLATYTDVVYSLSGPDPA